jgi:uncharacterized membrane protein
MNAFGFGCIGAVISAAFIALTVVLPISTFVRLRKAFDSIERLRIRVAELEEAMADARRQRSERPAKAGRHEEHAAPVAPAPEPSVTAPVIEPAPVTPARVEVLPAETIAPAPPPRAPEPEPVREAPQPVRVGGSLETEIGGRWLLYIGMAALVFGVGFFVKYAFDNEWITETMRVVLGGLFGVAMVIAGRRFAAKGYELYGQVIAGGGFGAMYVSAWAALNLYGLISRPTAFVLMALISVAAAVTADALRAEALAIIAVLGGFFAPALVGKGEDAQVTLLTYVAILTAGTMYLARRRDWPHLNLMSYGLTVLTFLGWADAYYSPAKYLPTQFYLVVFGAMFGWIFWRERSRVAFKQNPLPLLLFVSVPLLFHWASVANLFTHSLPLLLYLVLFTLAGIAAGTTSRFAWARLVVFIVTMPVFMGWLNGHLTPGWRWASIAVAAALYFMHLAGQVERLTDDDAAIDGPEVALFHANALVLFAALYAIVNAAWPYQTPLLAIGLAAWHGLLAWRARTLSGEGAVHGLAMVFGMLGFAVGLQFDDWWAVAGWGVVAASVYGAGVFTQRQWMRFGGIAAFLVVLGRLFEMDYFGTPAGFGAVLNPRAGATLVLVAALAVMAFVFRRHLDADDERQSTEYAALVLGANILTVIWISAELRSFWMLRTGDDANARFWMLASLSIAWGLYGTALLGVGIQRRFAPLRYLAIALLLLTVGKVFLVDLSELGGVYRIVGFMGLGVFLLVGAWLYQRFRDVILGARG